MGGLITNSNLFLATFGWIEETDMNCGVVITDPDDALTLANACLGKHFLYDFAKPWLGNGLITAPEPIWKHHRKLLNPLFSQQILNGYMGVFNKQARHLVDVLEQYTGRGPFDFMPLVYKNALETIYQNTLEFEVSDSKDIKNNYMDAVDHFLEIAFRRFKEPWLYFDILFQWSGLKSLQEKYRIILHSEVSQVLQRRRSELKIKLKNQRGETNENELKLERKCTTFLENLLERCGSFTDQEIQEHVDTTIVSGYDTVASALLFTTILIGSYPRVQEHLLEELKNVFDNTDRDVTKDDLPRLIYLDAVIKESLRIYSVIPAIARKIDRDVKLKNFTLRAGNNCIILLSGINHHPIWGTDAKEFKPERWLDRSTLPANASAFAAFSLGKRQCIGKAYAMMSLKTTLVYLLRHYKVAADHTQMVLMMDIILKPEKGHQIRIDRRLHYI